MPAYSVKIKTSCFGARQPFLKEKTQKEYLRQYWQKCRMDQKRISPSCEDRLSELTTGQIDRIIDMERIRTLLNDKKLKAREVTFEYDCSRADQHPHVYEANFLAKINAIAIRRNIRHEKSEGFDEYFGEQARQGDRDKKASQVPYKYLKKYKLDSRPKKGSTYHAEDDDEKSIESIQDEIDKFETMLEAAKEQGFAAKHSRKMEESERYSSTLRWFNGMSNHYLIKEKAEKATPSDLERMPNFDISSYLRPHESRRKHQSFSCSNSQPQSLDCGHRKSFTEPFVKYRINRIQRVTTIK